MLHWTKIFSGKFIFTIVTALVFSYAVYSKILNSEQVYGIIMLVVAAYFGRNTKEETNGKSQNPAPPAA